MTDEQKSTKFSKPLELESPGRAKLVFRSFEELRDWFQREETAWVWLRQAGVPGQNAWKFISSRRNQLTSSIAQINQVVKADQEFTPHHEQQLRSSLAQCAHLITSDSKAGKFVLSLKDGGDTARAAAAATVLLGQPLGDLSSPSIVRGAIDAVLMEGGITTEAIKAAQDEPPRESRRLD